MKKAILYISLILITALIVINPGRSISYALDSLGICYEIIIPSLFPFFVCSGLLVYSGFCNRLSKIMRPVMKPIFNINGAGAAAFVLGIISGYPLGALTACQLYEGSYLSKTETERLLAFCNNSGPLFILGSVGVSMYHSIQVGILLYISHILAAITVGILFRNYKKNSYAPPYMPIDTEQKTIGEIFQTALSNSINSILLVCGAVIFCSVISKAILDFIPVNGTLYSLILGAMEFVNGMSELSGQDMITVLKLIFSSWIVGFAGLSVHLQVMAVVAKYRLSLKPYIMGKILQGLIASLYTLILLKISKPISPVYANGSIGYSCFTASVYTILTASAVIGLYLGIAVLLFIKESGRIKKKMKNY